MMKMGRKNLPSFSLGIDLIQSGTAGRETLLCGILSINHNPFFLLTAVKPGIYGLAFTMGKWFLTDNSATVGPILIISSSDAHEILILIKW